MFGGIGAIYGRDASVALTPGYDVAADGRFLMLKADESSGTTIVMVQNWSDELKCRVPIQ